MIKNSQRTLYGLDLQMHALNGREYKPLPNTTLNEKFGILIDKNKVSGLGLPTIKYYTIGVGGLNLIDGIDTYSFSKHRPTDAGLFEHIPFVIRKTDNDLSPEDQLKYRFKKLETIKGVNYYCYYLKVINNEEMIDGLFQIDVMNSTPRLSKFNTNTDKLLNPIPRDPTLTMLDTENTSYVTKVTKYPFILKSSELKEINNVLNILYGYDNTKNITEIGICTGIDFRTEDGKTEAIMTQISYHMEVEINTMYMSKVGDELIRSLEIGSQEILVNE